MKAEFLFEAYKDLPPNELDKFHKALGIFKKKPISKKINPITTEYLLKKIRNKKCC